MGKLRCRGGRQRQDHRDWKQWDKLFRRHHSIYISPYDPEKNVWIVDDNMQAIYRFTHDGGKLLQTIGTPGVAGAGGTHFNRPTYIDWLPDGTFFVADAYSGTRVAKFDKNGKFLMDWGKLGGPPRGPIDTRPGYFFVCWFRVPESPIEGRGRASARCRFKPANVLSEGSQRA